MPTKLPNSYYVTHFFTISYQSVIPTEDSTQLPDVQNQRSSPALMRLSQTGGHAGWDLGDSFCQHSGLKDSLPTQMWLFFFLQGKSSRSTPDGFWLWDKFWDDILEDQSILIIFHEVIDEEDRNKCNFLVTSCSGWRWAFQSSSSWPIFALF